LAISNGFDIESQWCQALAAMVFDNQALAAKAV
jgi:hypothetical protein